jgi:hypothetical protein
LGGKINYLPARNLKALHHIGDERLFYCWCSLGQGVAMTEYIVSLRPEYLMEHMQAICQGIGPRPSTSNQERQAADYVERTLRRSDVTNIL